MDRRQFVRLSALAGASAAASVCRNRVPRESTDAVNVVVVVGAGLAGLRAADLLRKAGRRVIVLEARANPGGRVLTIRVPFDDGLYGEAGPIRIKSVHQTVLRLARELGLTLVPFAPPTGNPLISIGGARMPADKPMNAAALHLDLKPDERGLSQGELLERYLGEVPADLGDPMPTPAMYAGWQAFDQLTWPEWLRSRGASAGAVTLMTLGGDSSELSALYVLRQIALIRNAGLHDFKISGGMDLLPRAMAASLGDIVTYNAAVVRMNQDDGRVRVDYVQDAQAKSVVAGRVILAVPFSTLRQIEIRPPFSRQKEQAIEGLSYFPATRFLAQSRTRFWREQGLSGYARTDRPAEIWDCTHDVPGRRGILGATAGGSVGRALLGLSSEESVTFGKAVIEDAFPSMDANFEKGVAHRWGLEPWSRGAFAVFQPGQMSSMMPAIASPEGRVHFAGEHTSAWMGWMEGALQSGERAAREIMTVKEDAVLERQDLRAVSPGLGSSS